MNYRNLLVAVGGTLAAITIFNALRRRAGGRERFGAPEDVHLLTDGCRRTADFVGDYNWHDTIGSDPPLGNFGRLDFTVEPQVRERYRVVVRQGGRLVADFYSADEELSRTVFFHSDGNEVRFQITRCREGIWRTLKPAVPPLRHLPGRTWWTVAAGPVTLNVAHGSAIEIEAEADAIVRFAPEIHMHPDDKYMPCSVPWYLSRVRMRFDRSGDDPPTFLRKGEVNVRSLISQQFGSEHSGQGRTPSHFFLQIPNDDDEERTRRGDLANAPCYVHFRDAPGGGAIDIQYWFFYAFNGDITPGPANIQHEGDWEHVTVRITRDLQRIVKVFFATHKKESKWYTTGVRFLYGTHPIGYSAKNSHATYPSIGNHDRPWPRPQDETKDSLKVWKTWQTGLMRVGTFESPAPGQEWLKYTGSWGEIGTKPFEEWFVSSGPFGPALQPWWDDDDKMLTD